MELKMIDRDLSFSKEKVRVLSPFYVKGNLVAAGEIVELTAYDAYDLIRREKAEPYEVD